MKRHLIRAIIVVVAFGAALPAAAKGVQTATIEGPDIEEPIVLQGPILVTDNSAISRLADQTAFDDLVFRTDPWKMAVDEAVVDLDGVAASVVITWQWVNGAEVPVEVFTDTAVGPVVYMEPGFYLAPGDSSQGLFAVGGWFVAGDELIDTLVSVGVPEASVAVSGLDAPLVGLSIAFGLAVLVFSWRRLTPNRREEISEPVGV